MQRFARGLIIGASISLLLVGAAFAGPTRTDGDPDRPQITHPDRPQSQAAVDGVSARENPSATQIRSQVPSDNWKAVLKAYLQLIRVFTL